ncbi:MAG: hypothetical protein ACOCP8_04335 [archaeon]
MVWIKILKYIALFLLRRSLITLYKELDKNKDGKLTKREIMQLWSILQTEFNKIIK